MRKDIELVAALKVDQIEGPTSFDSRPDLAGVEIRNHAPIARRGAGAIRADAGDDIESLVRRTCPCTALHVGADHSIHKYLSFRFSPLASQSSFIPRPPIYAGVGENFSSQGQRMPPSRPEKFPVTQTHGLAHSRIFFQLKTNPFFGIGARSSSQRSAHISPEYKPHQIPSMQFKRQE
jgi:hypothetical protein